MMFDCRPEIRADMNTITPTPSATPRTMSMVWEIPSRMNRNAAIASNGRKRFIWPVALRGAGPAPFARPL